MYFSPQMQNLQFDSDRRLVSALLSLALAPMLWFLGADLIYYGNDWQRLSVRLFIRGVGLLIPIGGLLWVRSSRSREDLSNAALALSVAMVAVLITLNFLRPQGTQMPMRTPFMVLVGMYGALPNRLLRQIGPPLVYSAGILLQRVFWLTGEAGTDLPGDVLILLFVNAVGVLMVMRRRSQEEEIAERSEAERQARQQAEKALSELKALRGVIPICSHCHKLRAEAGEWKLLEEYARQHGAVEFSHGICPDCMQQHYPAFAGRVRFTAGSDATA